MALPSYSCKKPFRCCKVKWLIGNFSMQTITRNWLIQSPEFTIFGFEETRWFMTLRPISTNESNCVLFNLERSVIDSGPKYIWLNLKVDCIISGVKYICFNDMLQCLKNGSKYKACFGSIESLLSDTIRTDGEFTIICDMIIYHNNASLTFRECNQEGYRLLSKNMLDLYRSAQYFDTKLIFDDNVILAHKAILWARNEYLRFLLEDENDDEDVKVFEFQECTNIDFTDILDYKGMKKVLAYLYSGDMKHVLEEPSFAINDCANFLDISEIEVYYEPDELTLKSDIDFEEYTYTLCGYNFQKSGLKWYCDAEGSMKTYQLLFYPNKDCPSYIELFTKSSQKTINARLKLDFVYRSVNLCSIHLIIFDDVFTDINEKIAKHIKNLKFFDIIINLKVTTGMKISTVDKYKCVSVSCINDDMYYENLSVDMEDLFDGGPFTDSVIDNNGTNFWVHKCVLASRSRMFSDLLMTNEEGEAILTNFGPHIVSVVLTYIYSGLLSDVSDEEVIEVYKVAVFSNLPQLKSMCSKWLEIAFETNTSLRCRIVRLADINGDSLLMKSVLSYLFDRKATFLINYHPFSFQDVHACRHCLPTS